VKRRADQSGITLVVSLIMLVVLTLLVVSGIKFGNINLKISGNAQSEAEAAAATQVAVEQMLHEVNATEKVDTIAAREVLISTGGTTLKVNVAKPVCLLSKSVSTGDLDYAKDTDKPCLEPGNPGGGMFTGDGSGGITNPIKPPSACKDQQWDMAATLDDASTGAKVTVLQGAALRVGSQVDCPP
jgi:hypothetical protein